MSRMELFATPIWGFALQNPELPGACSAALRALRDQRDSVQKSNILGWQSTDDLHLREPFAAVARAVETFANEVVRPDFPRVERFELLNLWGNINPPMAANLGHTHEFALSGAFYLEVPEDSGRIVFCDPRIRHRGELGEDRVFSVATHPGGCVLFPAWLEHYVEPNQSDRERLSLAFNIEATLQ